MDRIPLSETDGRMAELVGRVEKGEEVVILRDGKPVAKLVPLHSTPEKHPIHFGLAKGQITIADDFDDPLPEDLLKSFYGLEPDEEWPEAMKGTPA